MLAGSIRQWGRNSWQIRVYAGTDPDTADAIDLVRCSGGYLQDRVGQAECSGLSGKAKDGTDELATPPGPRRRWQ